MKMQYKFTPLSKDEKEFLEMVLLDEIDLQTWYALTISNVLSSEIFMCLQ